MVSFAVIFLAGFCSLTVAAKMTCHEATEAGPFLLYNLESLLDGHVLKFEALLEIVVYLVTNRA